MGQPRPQERIGLTRCLQHRPTPDPRPLDTTRQLEGSKQRRRARLPNALALQLFEGGTGERRKPPQPLQQCLRRGATPDSAGQDEPEQLVVA